VSRRGGESRRRRDRAVVECGNYEIAVNESRSLTLLIEALPSGAYGDRCMSKSIYKVIRHDGGWAYTANGTFSEPFRTRAAARKAAKVAASEQVIPGETVKVSYDTEKGRWHNEADCGTASPNARVDA
jgi:hypothetical protein